MSSTSGTIADTKRILVFSTDAISDPGIDLAGSAHMHYPTGVRVLPVPCSSGIKPDWILYALQSGFDGVFIAACGGDCPPLSDCSARTGAIVRRAQELLKEAGISPKRVKMSGICSVCAEAFVAHMENFQKELASLEA
ncbi:MAG TPA: hydrogenase iron-sulfur subunit [Candidatus Hydrogenedentes bacterium]|nr:hydrogenase iron-sulfur subunit [Candidatus Hydrogenedentota bacterium]